MVPVTWRSKLTLGGFCSLTNEKIVKIKDPYVSEDLTEENPAPPQVELLTHNPNILRKIRQENQAFEDSLSAAVRPALRKD